MLDRENHNCAENVFSGGYSPIGCPEVIQTEAQFLHFPGATCEMPSSQPSSQRRANSAATHAWNSKVGVTRLSCKRVDLFVLDMHASIVNCPVLSIKVISSPASFLPHPSKRGEARAGPRGREGGSRLVRLQWFCPGFFLTHRT